MASEYDRRMRGGALFTFAMFATRPDTKAEAEGCRERLSRARDMLLHGPAMSVVQGELRITPAEFDELRPHGLHAMRWGCSVCGRCARHGIKPP